MVEQMFFKTVKVLPTVYEDALSYYEVLSKVVRKLNEVIETLNVYDPQGVVDSRITEKLNEYTANVLDPAISGLRTDLRAEVTSVINRVDGDISALSDIVTALTTECRGRYDTISNQIVEINALISSLSGAIANSLEQAKAYTDERVEGIVYDLPLMYNPFTGERDTIFNVVSALTNAVRTNALTANEYDALNLTANQYDSLNLSAYVYDWQGVPTNP